MSITSLLKQTLFSRRSGAVTPPEAMQQPPVLSKAATTKNHSSDPDAEKKVLNVGGNSKAIAIPDHYDGWTHHLLDIDPKGEPDIACDSRTLIDLPGAQYDSVYCSHNLEHYYSHDVIKVLMGFNHILKDDGFVDIRVPDIQAVVFYMVQNNMDIDDVLYETSSGAPIAIKDVMYGWGAQIEASGVEFFAHKTGFSEKSLTTVLNKCGFTKVYALLASFEIKVLGFKQPPTHELLEKLGLLAEEKGQPFN